jgi:RNA ligase
MPIEFKEWPKIPRYRREVAITEKLDGTSACVVWVPVDPLAAENREYVLAERELVDQHGASIGPHWLLAQSRQRFVAPSRLIAKADNYGWAQWVDDHADELMLLGPGYHYGEWWGYGIQRGYGVPEKRFSLFNVNRWGEGKQPLPACCHVVPLLGYITPDRINDKVEELRNLGSVAAPGYMRPEGIIVWHSQSKQYYKILLENDEVPKSLAK